MLRIGCIAVGYQEGPQGTCAPILADGPALPLLERPSTSRQADCRDPRQPTVAKNAVLWISCLHGSPLGWSSGKSQIKWLNEDELKSYGIWGEDPIIKEARELNEANYYGLSRSDYLKRVERGFNECLKDLKPPSKLADLRSCQDDFLKGRR